VKTVRSSDKGRGQKIKQERISRAKFESPEGRAGNGKLKAHRFAKLYTLSWEMDASENREKGKNREDGHKIAKGREMIGIPRRTLSRGTR